MSIEYWNNKLEKIQECLFYVRRIVAGEDPEKILEVLEKKEDQVTKDLIEAEQAEGK